MVCGCFTALEPRRLAVIDTTVNSAPYQKILKVNPRPSALTLKFESTLVIQQHNESKLTSKSTSEWQTSLDLNQMEMLWCDLRRTVNARKTSSVAKLKTKEKSGQKFVKDSLPVLTAKGDTTIY